MKKRMLILLAALILVAGCLCCLMRQEKTGNAYSEVTANSSGDIDADSELFVQDVEAEKDESVLAQLIVLEDAPFVLVPQTDGTLQVYKLDASADADQHVAFLQGTD